MGCSSSVPAYLPSPAPDGARCRTGISGVSLDYLLEFTQKNGGQKLAGWSSLEVCEHVIKPMTLHTGYVTPLPSACICDILRRYGATGGQSAAHMLEMAFDTRPGHVQRAHWFVTCDV
jgi:hypothetical protein